MSLPDDTAFFDYLFSHWWIRWVALVLLVVIAVAIDIRKSIRRKP